MGSDSGGGVGANLSNLIGLPVARGIGANEPGLPIVQAYGGR
jgi:hypothetical protein